MFNRILRRLAAMVAFLLVVLTATACSQPEPRNLVVVLGARSNVSVPGYPGPVERAAQDVADAGGRLSIVVADGAPREVFSVTLKPATGTNASRRTTTAEALKPFRNAFDVAAATSPESDLVGAVDVAARALGNQPGSKLMLVADSGLSTKGFMQFQNGLLNADPADVAKAIQARRGLTNLSGITVQLMGFGVTSPPQEPVPSMQARTVEAMWSTVFSSFGATVSTVSAAGPGAPRRGLPPVTLVPIEPVVPVAGKRAVPTAADGRGASVAPGETVAVIHDATIGFLPGSSRLRDPIAARSALKELALTAARNRWVLDVLGTTATWGSEDYRRDLSEQRAAVIAAILKLTPGVSIRRVAGLGSNFPGRIEDRLKNGELDPVKAALNRTVRVIRAR